jgi:hypothetical protein
VGRPVIPAALEAEAGRSQVLGQPELHHKTLSQKNKIKRTRGVAQLSWV